MTNELVERLRVEPEKCLRQVWSPDGSIVDCGRVAVAAIVQFGIAYPTCKHCISQVTAYDFVPLAELVGGRK